MPAVKILNVSSPQEKLNALCKTVQKHFDLKERLLITAPNKEAAEYIDLLLWRMPSDSFLPHYYSDSPINALVVITTTQENQNGARILLNLLPSVPPFYTEFDLIYDIVDTADASKREISHNKLSFYKTL